MELILKDAEFSYTPKKMQNHFYLGPINLTLSPGQLTVILGPNG
jgi:ABC-type siderophore export system fused ATPase/permease subunit